MDSTEAPSVRLVWVLGEDTDGCSDGASIARRVSTRLGKNVFSDAATTSIEGVIQRAGPRWEAHLYIRGADGKLAGARLLTSDGPTCEALDSATTLAVALAIDPIAALRPLPAAPPGPSAPVAALPAVPPAAPAMAPSAAPVTPPSVPPAEPSPVASPAARRPPPKRVAQSTVRGVFAAGLLPHPAFGVEVSTDIEVARFVGISAGALYLPEVHSGPDFAFGLTAGWLGGCAHTHAFVDLSACGKALLGGIHSVVYGVEPDKPGDRLWAGAALSAEASLLLLGPMALEVGGEAVAPLIRDHFVVQGRSGDVFQQQVVGGAAFVGLGVTIP